MQLFKKISKELKEQKFFKDAWLLSISAAIVVGNIFIIVWSITHIGKTEIEIPIRFTSLSNFDQLGVWYRLYEIAIISIVVSVVNMFLAVMLHRKNRILSIFVSIAALMVVILAIAILLGFTAIKYGTN